jgi:hypothetical protein
LEVGREGKPSLFNWRIEEEVGLIIFNRQSGKTEEYFSARTRGEAETQQKREEQKAGQDSVDLGALSMLSPKLRKAY